jgi:ferric-dicitrate binding protein FerR (iron transport regulator)
LVKGESASLENGLIKKSEVFDLNASAWKTRKLVFESTNIVQVVVELEEFYGVEITYDTNLSNCLITSTFENKTLDEVFEVLKIIAHIENKLKDNVYQLSGPDC